MGMCFWCEPSFHSSVIESSGNIVFLYIHTACSILGQDTTSGELIVVLSSTIFHAGDGYVFLIFLSFSGIFPGKKPPNGQVTNCLHLYQWCNICNSGMLSAVFSFLSFYMLFVDLSNCSKKEIAFDPIFQ